MESAAVSHICVSAQAEPGLNSEATGFTQIQV